MSSNEKKWIVIGLFAGGVIIGVGPFRNAKCNNPKTQHDNTNYKKTAVQKDYNSNEIIPDDNTKLTPAQWLISWHNAYNECYEKLPPLPQPALNIDPNEDLMEQMTFQPFVDRENEVVELIKEKYPELYAYRQYPEYEGKLEEQKQGSYKIMQELQQELQQANEEQRVGSSGNSFSTNSNRTKAEIDIQIAKIERNLNDAKRNYENCSSVVSKSGYYKIIQDYESTLEKLRTEIIYAK